MRVLIATTHQGIVGGVETYLRAVLPALAGIGYEIALLYEVPAAPGAAAVTDELHGVSAWRFDRSDPNPALNAIAAWRPDIIYSQGLQWADGERALVSRYPSILFAHNYHGTCVSGTKCHSRPEYEACTRTLGAGCLASYFPRRCGGLSPLTMLRLYRTQRRHLATLRRCQAVLVASRHMITEYRRHGLPDERLRLVPYFPPSVHPDPAPPLHHSRSDVVLFVGRITPLKGLRHLITAIPLAEAELGRRLTLVVAGDGPARAAAEADARRFKLRTEFLGWVESSRRTAEMRRADLLAVPSVWPEPFGMVGLEAGCVGLPAVGYATGGIPDWLIPGVSGESAPGHRPDPKALAAALVRALADDEHYQKLRVGAWETAGSFTLENHVLGLTSVLERFSKAQPSVRVGEG
jgi:glycosyltransferase involved in cell wall biosynthesis